MSQPGPNKILGETNATRFDDTTYTKIFVGGLAWETKRDTLGRYFEQFGEILEAVVINDKSTGRSKGYGFVSTRIPSYLSLLSPLYLSFWFFFYFVLIMVF